MKKILILFFVISLLVGCETKEEPISAPKPTIKPTETIAPTPTPEPTPEAEKIDIIYEDEESINLFLNKYNKQNDPDITSDMLTKKKVGPSERNDIVKVENDNIEIVIYGKGMFKDKMEVYCESFKNFDKTTNDFLKEQFIIYTKMFDDTLTDDEIVACWDNAISSGYSNSDKLNEIDIQINAFDGIVEYFKISSNIEFE